MAIIVNSIVNQSLSKGTLFLPLSVLLVLNTETYVVLAASLT